MSAAMAKESNQIDRDKVRAEVRKLGNESILSIDHIDERHDDVIFFADEGGSWQVGVDWAKVLSVWFKLLSRTAGLEDFAKRITALLSHHYSYGRDKMVAIALQIATPEQREALAKAQRG